MNKLKALFRTSVVKSGRSVLFKFCKLSVSNLSIKRNVVNLLGSVDWEKLHIKFVFQTFVRFMQKIIHNTEHTFALEKRHR